MTSDLSWLQHKFSIYDMGTKFDFNDIDKMLDLKNTSLSQSSYSHINDMSMKLFEEIYDRWFFDICIVGMCATTTKLACCSCRQKICSERCQAKHDKIFCRSKK